MLSLRLKQLRKERGLTQGALASRLGVTQQAVAKWETGRTLPEPGLIARMANLFGVTTDYLFGRADVFSELHPIAQVRIIGTVRAGYDALAQEENLGSAPAEVKNAEEYRYLVVQGDSMAPYIRAGDLALVHIQSELRSGDLGVIIYGDHEATLKKYHCTNGIVTLIPFNDAYPTLTLRGEELSQLTIFGRVAKTTTSW